VDIFVYPAGYWGHRGQGGWNIIAYLIFFICGYLIFANPRIMEVIKKLGWITLTIGVITFTCLVAFFLDEIADPIKYFGTTTFALAHFVQAFNTWCWLYSV